MDDPIVVFRRKKCGPYKHPKDGERHRKTAKDVERRRNTAHI